MIPIGTTPNLTFTFSEQSVDLTAAANVYVTFKSAGKKLRKTGDSLVIAEKQVSVYLTQEETLGFLAGNVTVQINWTSPTGGREASDEKIIEFSDNLEKEVLE